MRDQTKTTLDWLPACFKVLKISRTHVSGFITNKADLSTVLECHKRETLISFVAWSDDKRKKEQGPHRLVWQVEDLSENVPLAVTNRVIHCCQHGNPRNNCKNLELSTEHEHVYSGKRKRMYIQTTKKVGCTAKLFIRFDKFSVEKGALKKRKQIIMDTLKTALQKNEAESSEIIHISLPLETAHQHHKISAESGYTRNIHPLVKKKIQEKCSEAQIIDIKTSSQDGDCVSEDKPTMLNTFLFVHQSQEQQRLLKRYGDMVLLDATYRTTKYALPLFLVVVRTNVGYKPVAEFICENESIIAISEALSLIKNGMMPGIQNIS
ncbi:uncharacterized protein LOC122137012 isoform X2 [Cyprinus carpio]|uniref:Uncharacterized protein LOC122137012 isoform X2 n=1 Tax=Cyprinus carpio TaxID=7962 RepID=A0A9Q9ZXP9_CYPCA|nr:uncharacterized protein LOC122137012 isoform X2 [Cyprinus carpio]